MSDRMVDGYYVLPEAGKIRYWRQHTHGKLQKGWGPFLEYVSNLVNT